MKISLEAVSRKFGALVAVDRVSLEVGEGELFFIVGPSGCGKTTLLRLVAGFYDCDHGRILFDGRVVSGLPPHRRNTGMVFQNYALWPHLDVAGNVAFGLTVPGRRPGARERRARVAEALRLVHMSDYARARPNQLSGGQQQRVALARALVVRPGCLLLDEPLSNLDARLRLEMRAEIRRIVRETGITSIYVTHDQKEALSMADRCAVMNRGRLAQVGTPATLYDRPASRFVAEFIGEANIVTGRVAAVSGRQVTVAGDAGTWRGQAAGPRVPAAGEPALVVTRPEALAVLASGADTAAPDNLFHGRLVESVYLGEALELHVQPAKGPPLKVLTMAGAGGRPAVGDRLTLRADPARVLVFAGEPETPPGDHQAEQPPPAPDPR